MAIPSSTYRLQLGPDLPLAHAAALADYLRDLGAGAVYVSPILTAAPGSTHGYDVVDPTRVAPALGGEPARAKLRTRLTELDLGLVVDIVPNHMSIADAAANPWWWDVLRHGPHSAYAHYFDIDWSAGPIPLPILADDGDADALAQVRLSGDRLAYHEHRFPLAPGSFTPGEDPRTVHARQHYRLVSWRRGDHELTYRRFFDVTSLAAVRVEDPEVFTATHAEILRWARAGEIDGLRVDHPDGLTDPGGYTRRLRAAFDGWLLVEKILGADEEPPASWPVDGTTGYDALREICGVFLDPTAEPPLTDLAATMGAPTDYTTVEEHSRRLIATTSLAAEIDRIAALLPQIPTEAARAAVTEVLVASTVYRTYLPEGEPDWEATLARATHRRGDLADALAELDRTVRAAPQGEPARRLQQTSGMVVAKGTEDTALYRHTRFAALNEVGGAPERFGVPVTEFHTRARQREATRPATMTTLSTHDTKRSEDVRARLAVLTEIPEEFATAVGRWSHTHGLSEPSLNLLAWQTLIGAWPITPDRLRRYLEKAAREAKLATSWTAPDDAFEAEVRAWPDRVLTDPTIHDDVAALVDRVKRPGWDNALGQKLTQLTAPGIPDVYQGTELWDLSLVDPDNRRPVDYTPRRQLLARLAEGWLPDIDDTGAVKLHVVRQALRLRRATPLTGYLPLRASGPAADHALAFARTARRPWDTVTVATRLPVGLAARGGWHTTVLPLPGEAGTWHDRLTGQTVCRAGPEQTPTVALDTLLRRYPVALLERSPR